MTQKVLILGAYGLIGSAVLRAARSRGLQVTGMGRSRASATAVAPDLPWILRDLTGVHAADWARIIGDFDVVVNAAGALQDGSRDNLQAIHVGLANALSEAVALCPTPPRVIQISAAGVSADAPTDFFRTKAEADAVLATRLTDFVILRPTLVLAPQAYGGTALLRAAAALPGVLPNVYPHSKVQTVWVEDVASAVIAAAQGQIPAGTVADLTEAQARSLPELTAALRRWMGLQPARLTLSVPNALLRLLAKGADVLGWLGWRSPLRSNAMISLQGGITGDAETWERAGGQLCQSLENTLTTMPATDQDRVFARLYLLLPIAIAVLSVFWVLSGVITLANPDAARQVLLTRAAPSGLISPLVFGGAFVDIALGLAIVVRRWARRAAIGMVLVSVAYLSGSLIFAPDLWADPLGPMVKVLPATMLALFPALLVSRR